MVEEGKVPPGGSVTYINGRRIILDENGKPCRACNTLLDFQAATRGTGGGGNPMAAMFGAAAGAGVAEKAVAAKKDRSECPPDVEQLGRSTWTFLHSVAAQYPTKPTENQQQEMKVFLNTFSKIYPCWFCAEDLRTWMNKGNEPKVGSRDELGNWLCDAHNEVNKKLNKPVFDCKEWKARWRDGWADGRCD
ncbi:mitochondrial FAD-linked sulfhydryl oxidase Erv1p [Trichomonascus vanleenenianus]|uniref:flavin-linked sulfhydryl oxidase n=1 Tax=Trichomonascus vanleenenianus TaxID=2268995 RepID=UPI003ECB64D4